MRPMTHVESSAAEPNYLFRFKTFNGSEINILAPNMYLAMAKFQGHPQYDSKILVCTQLAKVDG